MEYQEDASRLSNELQQVIHSVRKLKMVDMIN